MKTTNIDGERWIYCENEEDVCIFIIETDEWKTVEEFENDLGFNMEDLINIWFTIQQNNLYIADNEIGEDLNVLCLFEI